jgi:hypothetical protein
MKIAGVHETWIRQSQVYPLVYFHTKHTILINQNIGLVKNFPSGNVWKGRIYVSILTLSYQTHKIKIKLKQKSLLKPTFKWQCLKATVHAGVTLWNKITTFNWSRPHCVRINRIGSSIKHNTVCYTQFTMMLRATCFDPLKGSLSGHIRSDYNFIKCTRT